MSQRESTQPPHPSVEPDPSGSHGGHAPTGVEPGAVAPYGTASQAPYAQVPPAGQAPPLPPAQAGGVAPAAGAAYGADDPRRKSPLFAGFLSLMPGLGQVYVGHYVRGFVHAITVAIVVTILSVRQAEDIAPLLGLFLAFFWLYNIIDAWRRATLCNLALGGLDPVEMPRDMQLPTAGGSIAGGLLLIVLGGILLSRTLFGISLDWVEEWWPVAPILLGVFLLGKAVLDRSRENDVGGGAAERTRDD